MNLFVKFLLLSLTFSAVHGFTWKSNATDNSTSRMFETTTVSITSIDNTTDSGIAPGIPADKLECGGIIDLPTEQFETKNVEYKLGEYYGNNELCIWILNASFYSVGIVVVTEGFQTNFDGLEAFHLTHGNSTIQSYPLLSSSNSSNILNGGQVFIMFSSDGSIPGTGFKLRLTSFGHISFLKPSYYHLDDHIGSLKYPQARNYSYNEMFLAVLQLRPNTTNVLQLSSLQTEANYDIVRFFQVFPFSLHREPYFDGQWSGANKTGSLSYSLYPRIVTFYSDGAGSNGAGFTFEWFSFISSNSVAEDEKHPTSD